MMDNITYLDSLPLVVIVRQSQQAESENRRQTSNLRTLEPKTHTGVKGNAIYTINLV